MATPYLDAEIGRVGTPSPGAIPNRFTLITKTRGPTGTVGDEYNVFASQYTAGGALWQTYAYYQSNQLQFWLGPNNSTFTAQAIDLASGDQLLAWTFTLDDGAGHSVGNLYRSLDEGATWLLIASPPPSGTPATTFSLNVPVRIGENLPGNSVFKGRIYSAEMKSGLDPTGVAVAGARLVLPEITGNYLSTPNSTAYNVLNTDVTWIFQLAPANYSISFQGLIAKRGVDGQNSFDILLNTGSLQLYVYGDGTIANRRVITSATLPVVPNNTIVWYAVTHDADNGAGGSTTRFFTSPDGVTWTIVGTPVTVATAMACKVGTSPFRFGETEGAFPFRGRYMRAIVRNGIGTGGVPGGTTVLDVDEALITNDSVTTFLARTQQIITITKTQTILQPVSSQTIFRFDAADYGGSGTTYTDPRGRVWTLDNDSAIVTVESLPPEHDATKPTFTIAINPPDDVRNIFEGDVVRSVRWVDIYEADNVTLWRGKVPITEGSVSVDMSRSERRNFSCTLYDDGSLGYGPDEFWYDKILKPYRGVEINETGDVWATPLGEFLPDTFDRAHFPNTISVSCRDFVKKLKMAKFADTTSFAAGLNVGTVIQTIAVNAGITKFNFATTSSTLVADTTFERDTERWQAIEELAAGANFEAFFSSFGYLVFRPYVDPLLAPLSYTFQTGQYGNLVSFSKATTDSFMFNDIVVHGSGQDNGLVWGRAENNNVNSPTRIAKIGRRQKTYPNAFVASNAKAAEIAASWLKVSGLEQFDMNLSSIVIPWLEAGDAVEVFDPGAAPGDPTRYLLSSFEIPLALDAMSGNVKRVTIVG